MRIAKLKLDRTLIMQALHDSMLAERKSLLKNSGTLNLKYLIKTEALLGKFTKSIDEALSATFSEKKMLPWDVKKALLLGQLLRMKSLLNSVLENSQMMQGEVVKILIRCLLDTVVSLNVFSKDKTQTEIKSYIMHSLDSDKGIIEAAKRSGVPEKFLTTIHVLLEEQLKLLGIRYEDIQKSGWHRKLSKRIKSIYFEKKATFFHGMQMMPRNHEVHGNWFDIYQHFLIVEGDNFTLNPRGVGPRTSEIIICMLLCMECFDSILPEILPMTVVKKLLQKSKKLQASANRIMSQHRDAIAEKHGWQKILSSFKNA